MDSELDLDAALEGFAELRIGRDELLQHPWLVMHGVAHPLAVMQRHVEPHHGAGDRILVDQQHLGARAGGGDRGGDAGRTGADDDDLDMALDRGRLAGDRFRVETR